MHDLTAIFCAFVVAAALYYGANRIGDAVDDVTLATEDDEETEKEPWES